MLVGVVQNLNAVKIVSVKNLKTVMKEYFKKLWNALWDSTEIDEKAEAALKEAKARLAEMKKELADVKNAAKNVIEQSKDVVDAAKGKKRRGKKPYNKNKNKKTKTNNNSKK